MRIAVGLEYDGSYFKGWQTQKGLLTVQEHVEKALEFVADQPVKVYVAGRTDAGVHAALQVIHFDTTVERSDYSWIMGANSYLDVPISLLWAREVDEDFHARFSAKKRKYRYVILQRAIRPSYLAQQVSWCYYELDEALMHEAGQYLLGEHDFSAFRAAGCQSHTATREVYSVQVHRQCHFIFVDIEANAFLYHMVRNIVGVLLAIGNKKYPVEWIVEVLLSRDRTCAEVTAPAAGLYLMEITYPDKYLLPKLSPCSPIW